MTDKERLELINKVNNEYIKLKIMDVEIQLKEKKLEILENDPIIKKYFKLKEEVRELENKIRMPHNSIDELWERSLIPYLVSHNNPDCKHEVCKCIGPYKMVRDPYFCTDIPRIASDEKDIDYKAYKCLECGKIVNEIKWNDFENSHIIINDEHTSVQYKDEFRCNLYSMSFSDARGCALKKLKINKGKKVI